MKRINNILIAFVLILFFHSNNSFSQWVHANFPSAAGNVYALEIKGANIIAGSLYGAIYFSSDNGLTWEQRKNGIITSSWIRTIALSGENIFTGTYSGGVFKSTNDGLDWIQVYYNYNEVVNTLFTTGNSIFQGSVTTSPYSQVGGAHRSTDEGSTWVELTAGLPVRPDIQAYTFNGNFLFTASFGQVFRSSDYGENWELIMNGLPSNPKVSRLNSNGTSVFMGSRSRGGYGIYRSVDNGLSWEAVNNGLPTNTSIGAFGTIAGNIFAGTTDGASPYPSGIYLSSDNGENWIAINEGLPQNTNVKSIAIKDSAVFIGTAHDGGYMLGGVWHRPLSELITDVEGEITGRPKDYKLYQNYPNPFNPTTTIPFSIPQSQTIELKVFDMLGNEVATLLNEYKEVGEHKVEFDGSDLISGIYFYRLKAGEFVQTKKFVLLK